MVGAHVYWQTIEDATSAPSPPCEHLDLFNNAIHTSDIQRIDIDIIQIMVKALYRQDVKKTVKISTNPDVLSKDKASGYVHKMHNIE